MLTNLQMEKDNSLQKTILTKCFHKSCEISQLFFLLRKKFPSKSKENPEIEKFFEEFRSALSETPYIGLLRVKKSDQVEK